MGNVKIKGFPVHHSYLISELLYRLAREISRGVYVYGISLHLCNLPAAEMSFFITNLFY